MKNNQLIIEKQETGKTTYLMNKIDELIKNDFGIIVLDSATEHENKSLLKKVANKYNSSIIVDNHNEDDIILTKNSISNFINYFDKYFPFGSVLKNSHNIICFDLSFFLEKGHEIYEETNDIDKYYYYRNLYNYLSEQIVLSLILMEKYDIIKKKVVVMDEIEFPITDYDISKLQKDIQFIASVHPENAFGTFYKSFEKIKFKAYHK